MGTQSMRLTKQWPFSPNLEIMVSSMQKKTGCDFRESGMSFKARDAVTFMNLE